MKLPFRKLSPLFVLIFIAALSAPAAASPLIVAPRQETAGEVTLYYPEVEGLGPAGQKINRTLAGEIDAFARSVAKPDHSGQVNYTVQLDHNQLLSITISEMYYVRRAAHPMTMLRGFTFNTATGDPLKLSDLFPPDCDFRGKLNQIMARQLAERQIPLLRKFDGIRENQEFYLTPDSLVIYYQLYEYTPYAWGFLKFSIPYGELSGILKPEFVE